MTTTIHPVLPQLCGNARATDLGLQQITFESLEDWQAYGLLCIRMYKAFQWILGDWWNSGEKFAEVRFEKGASPLSPQDERDLYQAISRRTHLGDGEVQRAQLYTHLTNLAYVARHVPESIRLKTVDWTHHREVAPLERKEQVRLLRLCASEKWSVMDLRQEIRGKAAAASAPVVTFVLPRWKNEFLREIAREDIRQWSPERRAATKAELQPIVEFWKRL